MPVSFSRLSAPQRRTTYPGIYMGGPCWDKKGTKSGGWGREMAEPGEWVVNMALRELIQI